MPNIAHSFLDSGLIGGKGIVARLSRKRIDLLARRKPTIGLLANYDRALARCCWRTSSDAWLRAAAERCGTGEQIAGTGKWPHLRCTRTSPLLMALRLHLTGGAQ